MQIINTTCRILSNSVRTCFSAYFVEWPMLISSLRPYLSRCFPPYSNSFHLQLNLNKNISPGKGIICHKSITNFSEKKIGKISACLHSIWAPNGSLWSLTILCRSVPDLIFLLCRPLSPVYLVYIYLLYTYKIRFIWKYY